MLYAHEFHWSPSSVHKWAGTDLFWDLDVLPFLSCPETRFFAQAPLTGDEGAFVSHPMGVSEYGPNSPFLQSRGIISYPVFKKRAKVFVFI